MPNGARDPNEQTGIDRRLIVTLEAKEGYERGLTPSVQPAPLRRGRPQRARRAWLSPLA